MSIRRFIVSLTLSPVLLACAPHSARPVLGDLTGGTFATVEDDTVPRVFHRASVLQSGLVMVTGGTGMVLRKVCVLVPVMLMAPLKKVP